MLASHAGLEDYERNEVHGALLDLLLHALVFGERMRLSAEQTSALYGIVKSTHATMANDATLEETFAQFKSLVVMHSVDRPPESMLLFGIDVVRAITEYVLDTFFRHFELYKHCFTNKRIMSLTAVPSSSLLNVVAPHTVPPLADARLVLTAPGSEAADAEHGAGASAGAAGVGATASGPALSNAVRSVVSGATSRAAAAQPSSAAAPATAQAAAVAPAAAGVATISRPVKSRGGPASPSEVVADAPPDVADVADLKMLATQVASVQLNGLKSDIDAKLRHQEAELGARIAAMEQRVSPTAKRPAAAKQR